MYNGAHKKQKQIEYRRLRRKKKKEFFKCIKLGQKFQNLPLRVIEPRDTRPMLSFFLSRSLLSPFFFHRLSFLLKVNSTLFLFRAFAAAAAARTFRSIRCRVRAAAVKEGNDSLSLFFYHLHAIYYKKYIKIIVCKWQVACN
jgi:hypothetical protein